MRPIATRVAVAFWGTSVTYAKTAKLLVALSTNIRRRIYNFREKNTAHDHSEIKM